MSSRAKCAAGSGVAPRLSFDQRCIGKRPAYDFASMWNGVCKLRASGACLSSQRLRNPSIEEQTSICRQILRKSGHLCLKLQSFGGTGQDAATMSESGTVSSFDMCVCSSEKSNHHAWADCVSIVNLVLLSSTTRFESARKRDSGLQML